MGKKLFIKLSIAFVVIASLIFAIVLVQKHNGKIEEEKRLEARFDRFMGYLFPYLKEYAYAADIFKRMQISLMYDHIKNRRGRYINEIVNYYDGGYFSMYEYTQWEFKLEQAKMLYFSRPYLVTEADLKSRNDERIALIKILDAIRRMLQEDIYDDDISIYDLTKRKQNILDSLNFEIQSNFHGLIKYNNLSPKIDLNSINESDYDLSSY